MSSIIVLDSSDDDETPTKKPNLQSTSSSVDFGNSSNSSNCKSTISSKQGNLPSGITITPHNSHGTHVTKTQSSSAMQLSHTSSVLGTNINYAINNLINNEHQTPTPPRLPVLLTQRKRKPTSPPSSLHFAPNSFANMGAANILSPAAAATTLEPDVLQLTRKPTAIYDLTSSPDRPSYTSVSLDETPITHHPNRLCGNQLNGECGKGLLTGENDVPAESSKNEQKTEPPPKLPLEAEFEELIEVCRNADASVDMNKLNKTTKLVKYTDVFHLTRKPTAIYDLTSSPDRPFYTSVSLDETPIVHHLNRSYGNQLNGECGKGLLTGETDIPAESPKNEQKTEPPPKLPLETEFEELIEVCRNADASVDMNKLNKTTKLVKYTDVFQFTRKPTAIYDLTSRPDRPSYTSVSLNETPIVHHPKRSCGSQLNGECGKGLLIVDNDKPAESPKNYQQTKPTPKLPLEPEFEELIEVCRNADASVDMNKLNKTMKLVKYTDVLQLTRKSTEIYDSTSRPYRPSYTSVSLNEKPIVHHPNRSCGNQLNGECGKGLLTGENYVPAKFPKNDQQTKPPPKLPLEPEFEERIEVCRNANPSVDMNKLNKTTKLVKYTDVFQLTRKPTAIYDLTSSPDRPSYTSVSLDETPIIHHPNRSCGNQLDGEYGNFKIRRKAKVTDAPTTTSCNEINSAADISDGAIEEKVSAIDEKLPQSTIGPESLPMSSTGNKKLHKQIKMLNKTLYVLWKRIDVLEQSEVDWDDDDSSFLRVERFKKRACQIYEKICDLTGESKNARRLVKKPIRFNETRIPQFNKTLQAFINRTKEFPDYYDVLRMLEHCNRTYSLGIVHFEIKNIAEDAFIKVGKLLQSRRKADLFETLSHFGREKDPAQSDPILAAKLNENQKNWRKIEVILGKFARKQDMPEEEDDEDNKAENTKVIYSVEAMERAAIDRSRHCCNRKSGRHS